MDLAESGATLKGLAVADECIHGFDDGLCAQCFPPPEPVVAAVPLARVSRSRTSLTSPARTTSVRGAKRRVPGESPASSKPIIASEQRLYHVTHIDNLPAILSTSFLKADADGRGVADVDVATPLARKTRRDARISENDTSVAEYVPFYLSPDAKLWNTMRSGGEDWRITPAPRAAADFVVVGSTVGKAIDAGECVVSNADAGSVLANFAATPEDVAKAVRRLRANEESGEILEAELLVHDTLSFDAITLIGVGNDKVRVQVKRMLAAEGFGQKVAVYPPWFQSKESEDLL